jgi:hypothetical protein
VTGNRTEDRYESGLMGVCGVGGHISNYNTDGRSMVLSDFTSSA